MIRDAQPARLRELVEMLEGIEPGFRFTNRAEEIIEGRPGELVLLALREQDLDWLNLNRPQFAQRELRAVLWAEISVSATFRFRAPDLHDWVSHFVRCPPGVPRFACEGLRVGLRWWPGVAWRGDGLDLALAQASMEPVATLDANDDFASLVARLSRSRNELVRWAGIHTARGLWRARWALARAGHHGPNVLDTPTVETPGWFPISSQQLELGQAVLCLQQAGIAQPCKMAAHLELEPGSVRDLADGSPASDAPALDEEARARVVTLRADPHVQRIMHEHPVVVDARQGLVKQMRRQPTQRNWSRFELAVFASIERDRRAWPDWGDFRTMPWTIEHSLRVGMKPELRQTILDIVAAMSEESVERYLAADWDLMPGTRTDMHTRNAQSLISMWLDTATRAAENSQMRPVSGAVHPEVIEAQVEGLEMLADGLGWDASFVTQSLAQFLWLLVTLDAHETLLMLVDRALHAASEQLGARDPGYGTISRITGLALGAAGHFERASEQLRDAWELQRQISTDPHTELTTELAMVLAARGRFSDASMLLRLTPSPSEDTAARVWRFILRGAGEPLAKESVEPEPIDIQAEARKCCNEQLRTFWPLTAA